MGMRERLRRLQREVEGNGIVLRLGDGTVRVFETMEVHKEMFLARMDLLRDTARESEVLEAVRKATVESRREFEERFGPIVIRHGIISAEGWAEVYTLTEGGEVERERHEAGSEEAERLRRQAREGPAL